jgi:hypothetical protein
MIDARKGYPGIFYKYITYRYSYLCSPTTLYSSSANHFVFTYIVPITASELAVQLSSPLPVQLLVNPSHAISDPQALTFAINNKKKRIAIDLIGIFSFYS